MLLQKISQKPYILINGARVSIRPMNRVEARVKKGLNEI